ncbi:MAG: NAD(P)-dependent oxidoreductase [Deltaproteobacteria bacterium]|nr:NAD(P)-dependent oxidoreductase [Deltaproteobacteria bacterium]
MELGFIGLGNMGVAMVKSLLRAGHQVVVWNRTREKAEALRSEGARVADAVADACRGDAVITMLADDGAVQHVACGAHGILDALAPGKTIHVSMSTISPRLVRNLAERHAERNQLFLSAPVLGRPAAAEHAQLTVLAAGPDELIEAMKPAFFALGPRVLTVGPEPESANVVKVACNAMIASVIEALGETLALVTKAGVEPRTYVDLLLATVLSSPMLRPYGQAALAGSFEPGFAIPLALKDMELALGVGRERSVPLPTISLIRDHMIEAIATGNGGLDWSALALVAQREAGLATQH